MITFSEFDRTILRRLADQYACIAEQPVHQQTIEEWKRLNGLGKGRPMLWVDEIPWHEMNVDDELTIQSRDPFCRRVEWELRQIIYKWNHMRGNMVVEKCFYSSLIIQDTGFGLSEEKQILKLDARNDIVSQHFVPQIQSERDIEKIRPPVITLDIEQTDVEYQILMDLIGNILPVEKRGVTELWFAPWDLLVTWWGVQQALIDLIDRPELVHYAMVRLVTAHMSKLDQYEKLGLLALNNTNVRIGSGGLGYVDELPKPGYVSTHVRPVDAWGSSAAQIFSSVSSEMHAEFALQYERIWLERFGLVYYGCCEPLDQKVDILRTIPNLRKISMSPWTNLEVAARNTADQYVLSIKPNPSIFAGASWDVELCRNSLRVMLEKVEGCVVEIIMKDISTVCYQPHRLWEWTRMASDVIDEY